MENYDKIILTSNEKFILVTLRFKKKRTGNIYSSKYSPLLKYGLIAPNYFPNPGSEGERIPDGTFSLTDTYKRYCIYQRKQRIHRYVTPIAVSAATTVVLHILQQLWLPALLDWLQGLS